MDFKVLKFSILLSYTDSYLFDMLGKMKQQVQAPQQAQPRFSMKWAKRLVPGFMHRLFLRFDKKVDGAISFFFKHYGKSRFMVAMSKKVQYLGIEKVWNQGPKAFIYFFLFYLVRDTILYIIIPIFFARATAS